MTTFSTNTGLNSAGIAYKEETYFGLNLGLNAISIAKDNSTYFALLSGFNGVSVSTSIISGIVKTPDNQVFQENGTATIKNANTDESYTVNIVGGVFGIYPFYDDFENLEPLNITILLDTASTVVDIEVPQENTLYEVFVNNMVVTDESNKYNHLKAFSEDPIISFDDNLSNGTTVFTDTSKLQNGDIVEHYNTLSYNGSHKIFNVTSNSYDIPIQFVGQEPNVGRWSLAILSSAIIYMNGKSASELGLINKSSATDIKEFYTNENVIDGYFKKVDQTASSTNRGFVNLDPKYRILDITESIQIELDFFIPDDAIENNGVNELASCCGTLSNASGLLVAGAGWSVPAIIRGSIFGEYRFGIVFKDSNGVVYSYLKDFDGLDIGGWEKIRDSNNVKLLVGKNFGSSTNTIYVRLFVNGIETFSGNEILPVPTDFSLVDDYYNISDPDGCIIHKGKVNNFQGTLGRNFFLYGRSNTVINLFRFQKNNILLEEVSFNESSGDSVKGKVSGDIFKIEPTSTYLTDKDKLSGSGVWLDSESNLPPLRDYIHTQGTLSLRSKDLTGLITNPENGFSIIATFKDTDVIPLLNARLFEIIDNLNSPVLEWYQASLNQFRVLANRLGKRDFIYDNPTTGGFESDSPKSITFNDFNTIIVNYIKTGTNLYRSDSIFINGYETKLSFTPSDGSADIDFSAIKNLSLNSLYTGLSLGTFDILQFGVFNRVIEKREIAEQSVIGLPSQSLMESAIMYYQFQLSSIINDGVSSNPVIKDLSGNNYNLEVFGLPSGTIEDKIESYIDSYTLSINE